MIEEKNSSISVISEKNWETLDALIPRLQMFSDMTNVMSSSCYPTSNIMLCEMVNIVKKIYEHRNMENVKETI